ncbi:pilin fimbrial protein [Candidatus Nitrosoglobus terrae]|uniref:Pilin fimbrial protein n=1 Tax=Candidatus Nitrosoglobus terrae TaxID=1630141 RepID=A0A1Q2SLC2_9GAMM|nr:pilin [Candidatus Nitrosoglobus terrae]BAW79951.1 pilin fimbrial protein [Candidatus Nitrosoglobus terrae]
MMKQQGFTLIELMIAVAIVGVLAAVAIPQYQTYVAKTQVTRAISESSALKTVVEDCLNNGIPDGQCDPAGSPSDILKGSTQGSEVAVQGSGFPQVTIGAKGADSTIIATLSAQDGGHAATAIDGDTVTLTRDGTTGAWKCIYSGAAKYSPASCPGTAAGG